MFERFTVQARDVVMRAREEARALHHAQVGTEHLLLALLCPGAGSAYTVLHEAGVDGDQVRAQMHRRAGTGPAMFGEMDAAALRTIGIDLDAVLSRIEEAFGPAALDVPPEQSGRGVLGRWWRAAGGGFGPQSKKVLELSLREALRLKNNYIGTEHILLGLIRAGDCTAAEILAAAGTDLVGLRRAVEARLRAAA